MTEDLGQFEQLCLMALMRLGPDANGRELWEEIEKRTEREVPVTQVYVTMDRLEKKGFVRSAMGEATAKRGGKPKKLFSITAPGERTLSARWGEMRAMASGLGLALGART
jgi:PadR family transcriptional regulator, regulatory protein PadR